jgi:hypothetical protein
VVRPSHQPGARLREKAGEAEIGHDDHHAEQQGERVGSGANGGDRSTTLAC